MDRIVILEFRPEKGARNKGGHPVGRTLSLHGMNFEWVLYKWIDVKPGDEFFLLILEEGFSYVLLHGVFKSELTEKFCKSGRKRYIASLEADFLECPTKYRLLEVETLKTAMPDFNWYCPSGNILPDKYVPKIRQMWKEYLEMNDDFIKPQSVPFDRISKKHKNYY